MPIDVDCLAACFDSLIDEELPTEATFRGQTINIRAGEAPQSRSFVLAGFIPERSLEALIKRDDVGETPPAGGETVTIGSENFKIKAITVIGPMTDPAAYRVTLVLK